MNEDGADQATQNQIRMGRPGVAGPGRDRFGLTGVSQEFDLRIVAVRPDLADIAIAGVHFAPHYAAPMIRSCVLPAATLREAPAIDAEQTSELLFGEPFALLDLTGGWAWGYCLADHYVGYLAADALGEPIAPTHRVVADGAPIHAAPDRDSACRARLSFGAQLMGEAVGEWLETAHGFVPLASLDDVDATIADPVALAEQFVGAPFLPGGRSRAGFDCSGLVQLCFAAAGIALPRDSDLQFAAIKTAAYVDPQALQRGDLVFFPGHVGMMTDAATIVHASLGKGAVVREPLATVIARSAAKGNEPPLLAAKRLL